MAKIRISQLEEAENITDNDLLLLSQNQLSKNIKFSNFIAPLNQIETNTENLYNSTLNLYNKIVSIFNVREIEDSETEISNEFLNNINVNKIHTLSILSIPLNLQDAAEGDVISLENWIQDGIIQITPQEGVTLNYRTIPINLGEQGYLRYIGNNNWLLFGNI